MMTSENGDNVGMLQTLKNLNLALKVVPQLLGQFLSVNRLDGGQGFL